MCVRLFVDYMGVILNEFGRKTIQKITKKVQNLGAPVLPNPSPNDIRCVFLCMFFEILILVDVFRFFDMFATFANHGHAFRIVF